MKNAMARAVVSPIDTVLPGDCLQLIELPIARLATHGFEELGSGVHELNSITDDIIRQPLHRSAITKKQKE
jgi:hypothetical protein